MFEEKVEITSIISEDGTLLELRWKLPKKMEFAIVIASSELPGMITYLVGVNEKIKKLRG